MDDNHGGTGRDPEERAFTGHPDHPPAQPDFAGEKSRELLRDQPQDPASEEDGTPKPGGSPGEATSLPGYGG